MSYDPTREWTIAAADLTLPNNNFHWLYVKVPIDPAETTAVIVASETHIDALPEDGYIYYKIGFAPPVADGARELHTLWGASRPGSGGGTDDKKVKYDAADPTAGYLSEKIVAGANITIEEGTGADENKVKISAATDNSIEIYIDFLDTTPFVFTAPYAMKFTAQTSEGADATLSPVLNTDLAQYDDVTITPAEAGLIIITGTLL